MNAPKYSHPFLTPKQRRFLNALSTAPTQRQAAIDAGYSPASAGTAASQTIRNLNFQKALAAKELQEADDPGILSIQQRKQRLSELAQPNPIHPDPLRAIDILNRMENLYVQRPDTTEVRITVVYVDKGKVVDEGAKAT